MSADRYSLFYCLTETGWTLIEEANHPDGWIRIYEVEVHQGSPFGQESRTWHLVKTHPDWNSNAADNLEQKFPRPERPRELSPESLRALGLDAR